MVANGQDDFEHGHLLSPLALAVTATRGLPKPFVSVPHLQLLSNELVKLRLREPGWPRRLMVTMPVRHGKSETCSHWFPVWDLALDPADKIICASYEAEFAAHWGRLTRRSVQEHYPILGARVTEDSKAAHRWETREGGGMTTAGVGGPITGKGGNILILDDPIKNAEEANSQLIRDNLWEWWQTTFLTRLEPDGVIVLIMSRWHEDDLIGRLMASPEFKFWRHVDLPAVAEGGDSLGRPRGAALWPERYDETALEDKRAEIGSRAFNALYQQHPTPPEGSAIHRSWWSWYDEAPPLETFDQIIQSWDTTFKNTATSDFVAGGLLGRKGSDIYVLDVQHERMNGPETLKAIKTFDQQWPQAVWAIIEDSASGSMILDILERERGHVVRVKTGNRSKETRLHWGVNSAAAIIERGRVFLKKGASWSAKIVNEAAAFPHGTHDDLIDMLVQAIEHLMPKVFVSENLERRNAREPKANDFLEIHTQEIWKSIHARIAANQREAKRANRERNPFTFLDF